MENRIQLAVFDIDGTLVTKHTRFLPDSTIDAINALRNQGVKIAIASGRPPYAIEKSIKEKIDFDYYIGSNGSVVIDRNGVEISKVELSNETVEQLIEQIEKDDQSIMFQFEEGAYCYQGYKRIYDMLAIFLGRDDILFDARQERERHKQSLPIAAVARIDENLINEYKNKFNECTFVEFHKNFYDLCIEGTTKLQGVKTLCEKLNIELNEVAAFGDGLNDLEMIEGVKYGIAMEEAEPEVKQIADFITTSPNEDGIKKACLHFGWIEHK